MSVEPLPRTGISNVIGLLEFIDDAGGKEDVFRLTRELQYDLEDILPVIEASELLELSEVSDGDIKLTALGKKLLESDVNERKLIVKRQLKKIKVFQEVISTLKARVDRHLDREFVVELFETNLSEEDAESLVHTLIEWGRYAELIGYNHDTEEIYLDQEDQD
ncbi:MAG: AAA-associated domain-containing protein [Actinomycetota bacterium]|nr:AAA-associated domain-containing protein [Actinomycetota bacterium]MDI6822309.1 AAA-associated domain-containing protein [Actinomycetota bacterium]